MAEKTRGIRVEQGPKRVRAYLGGELVADTKTPFLVWEWPYFPTYYFPAGDVRAELVQAGQTEHSPSRGDGQVYHIKVAGAAADGAALRYPDSPIEALRDLVRLDWNSMSEWFEEDEPVYVHPRDPYSRVDILASSRHVRVEIDGVTVADSRQPRILFETGLPPRYYVPLTDLRMDLLRASRTRRPTARTRARPPTGRWTPGRRCTPTSCGSTGHRCRRARRSPGWPASTTRRWTSTWTVSYRTGPGRTSARPC